METSSAWQYCARCYIPVMDCNVTRPITDSIYNQYTDKRLAHISHNMRLNILVDYGHYWLSRCSKFSRSVYVHNKGDPN